MKAKILLAIFLVFVLASFVSAIPKDFEVSNVFWAAEGTMKDSEGFDKPFLLGLVELSWETDKGKTNSPVVYLDYNGGKNYSYSLGFIKGVDENSSSAFCNCARVHAALSAGCEEKDSRIVYAIILNALASIYREVR